jgi:hypothetical protein
MLLLMVYSHIEGVSNVQVCTLRLIVQWYDFPCSMHEIVSLNPSIMQKKIITFYALYQNLAV